MSDFKWKPGDVAACSGELVIYTEDEQWFWVLTGLRCMSQADVAGRARPLIVVDPENDLDAERLCAAMKKNGWTGIDDDAVSDMQTVLRNLVAPPKPDEPKGLGAVVEDQSGRRWVRIEPEGIAVAWTSHVRGEVPKEHSWSNIAAVRVLSEGVA